MAVVIDEFESPDVGPNPGGQPGSPGFSLDTIEFLLDGDVENALYVISYTCREAMSTLYRMEVEFENRSSRNFGPESFLGKQVAIRHTRGSDRERYFCGVVSNLEVPCLASGYAGAPYERYRITIAPRLWLLTQNVRCRVLGRRAPSELLTSLLSDPQSIDHSARIASADTRFRVQYNESDFSFLSRTCEELGIFYFFEQPTSTGERLIFGDQVTEYRSRGDFHYAENVLAGPCENRQELRPRSHGVRVHDFVVNDTDHVEVSATRSEESCWAEQHRFESMPAEPNAYELCNQQARIRMETSEWGSTMYSGEGFAIEFMPGYFFSLHPSLPDMVMLSVHHEFERRFGYRNSFTCMPRSTVFRPPRVTPRPVISGTQTAIVRKTASSDPMAMGRVSIRFHWQHGESRNHECWTRVANPWAGENYGAYFPAQVGDEVVLSFLDGDPAQPLIIGRVYNGPCQDQHSEGHLSGWIGPGGTKIEMDHRPWREVITLSQPMGNIVEVHNTGRIEIQHFSGARITLDPAGKISMEATQVQISSPVVRIDSAMVKCAGVVRCDTLIANNVISASYTPGAGNIW